ncbi:MAG: amidohydrolase [Planctomycetes bacterium]|nr:amidohydrolase [Planctomycetota bacterium]
MFPALVLASLLAAPLGEQRTAAAPETAPAPAVAHRLLLTGGRIRLGDEHGGVVEALLVEDGYVVAAGTAEALEGRVAGEELVRVDLDGAVAVPGFQDAHAQLERLGEDLRALDLSGVADLAELDQLLAEQVKSLAAGAWLIGCGLSEEVVQAGGGLHRARLDLVAPKHPVFLRRATGRVAWVNGAALERVGLAGVVDPPPRNVGPGLERDSDKRANGRVVEEALSVFEAAFRTTDDAQLEALLLAAQERLLARGWTCVHDMGERPAVASALARLRDDGRLKLRVVGYLDGNAGMPPRMASWSAPPGDTRDLFRVAGVLFRLDGSLETRAAALVEPYSDAPQNTGRLLLTEQRLTALVHECWQAGWQPAVAAVGDRANRVALDVYERMTQVDESFVDLRPRIEHATMIAPRDFARVPGYEVVTSMQPVVQRAARAWLEARLGPQRLKSAEVWRRLVGDVGRLALGTGPASGTHDPLVALVAMRDLQYESLRNRDLDREPANSELELLYCLSGGPAFAAHQDGRRGRLTPGFGADLTVLDVDPVTATSEELAAARVLMTIVDGEVVWTR